MAGLLSEPKLESPRYSEGDGSAVSLSLRLKRFVRLISKFYLQLRVRLDELPIVIFYKYLYETNKPLLFRGIFVNYILPLVLEILPFWWLSSRKLGNSLRKTRIKLNHNMATGKEFVPSVVLRFLWLTVFHAILDTCKRHAMNRVAIENRLLIRRLVFERLLYSEMGAFEKLRTLDIEYRISADISQTLNFFSFTLPNMIASLYALIREGFELYRLRRFVDPLALLHPILIGLLRKLLGYIKYHFIEKKQRDVIHKTRTKMSRLVSNALDGLADIQVNNLQEQQLRELDKLIQTELSNSLGMKSLVYNTWNLFSHRNVLEFVAELYVVHKVMQRQQISHERYGKIQHDINRVIQLAQRLYGLVRITRNMLEFQKEVVELVNIPNFQGEHTKLKTKLSTFKELRVANMLFSYKDHDAPALDFYGTLVFEPGKRYALIGQNRSGKSTVCKLICKLYQPQLGSITLNGISYHRISRMALRDYISYLSQKPYLFPGTIRDNIKIGNPDATEEQVYQAAEAAGVFAFGLTEEGFGDDTAEIIADTTNRFTNTIRRSMSMNDMMLEGRRGILRRGEAPSENTPGREKEESDSPPIPRLNASAASSPAVQPRKKKKVSYADTVESELQDSRSEEALSEMSGSESEGMEGEDMMEDDEEEDGEEKGILRRVLSFVWEAETDYHSYYNKKKEQKKKRKERQLKKEKKMRRHMDQRERRNKDTCAILDMRLTSRGGNISGGFAQSVALARIFVRTDAKILILDEAFGQMDAYKKTNIIYPALMKFVKKWDMTLILVSHDMQSIQNMDVIYVMHQGKLVHQGSHEQLLAEKAELYLQLLGQNSAAI